MERPPALRPDFFDTPDFRAAFATREIGRVFRLYRTDPRHWPVYGRGGIGQDLLGSWLGLTQTQVSRIETGRTVPHDLHALIQYAQTLHLPERLLWFDLPNSSRLSTVTLGRDTSKWTFDDITEGALASTGADLIATTQRLQNGLSALTGNRLTEPLQSWLRPLRIEAPGTTEEFKGSSPVLKEEELEFLERELQTTYRGWKNTGSGLLVRKVVIAQLNEVVKRLRAAEHGPTTDRAFRLAAGLAKVAASTSYDAGLPGFAQRYYMVSVQLAKIAHDDVLAAVTLADLARQSYDLGQPNDGLEIVQLAQYGTRRLRIPRLRSVLATREAWAYAQRGEKQEFYRAVGLAEDHFLKGQPTMRLTQFGGLTRPNWPV
jgi:transcriptional regulator with XRE-family HTH domain